MAGSSYLAGDELWDQFAANQDAGHGESVTLPEADRQMAVSDGYGSS
jgi:hypothetical protein